MAKKVMPPPRPPSRTPGRLLAAAGALLLMGSALAWLFVLRPAARVHGALPTVPDATHLPAAFADALELADRQARRWTNSETGVIELGRLYHANGFNAEAEACWSLLARLHPAEARWPYLHADLRARASDDEAMVRLWRRTVELDPGYAPAWLKLADFATKRGQRTEAKQAYERRLQLLPGDPYARFGLARLALEQGQTAAARAQLRQLTQDTPTFSPAHNLFAELVEPPDTERLASWHRWLGREAGRYRKPADAWLDELDAFCYDPEALRLMATIAFQTQQNDTALALIDRAVRLAPDRPGLREAQGDLLLKLNQPARARETLEAGLAAGPSRVTVPHWVYLAQACRQTGRPTDALDFLQRALAAHPNAFELHHAAGQALAELGRREEARAAFARGVAIQPNDAQANFDLAMALIALGRLDEAVACLQRSLTSQPSFAKSLKLLARIELDSGRPEEARRYLSLLLDAHPGDPQAQQLAADVAAASRQGANLR